MAVSNDGNYIQRKDFLEYSLIQKETYLSIETASPDQLMKLAKDIENNYDIIMEDPDDIQIILSLFKNRYKKLINAINTGKPSTERTYRKTIQAARNLAYVTTQYNPEGVRYFLSKHRDDR